MMIEIDFSSDEAIYIQLTNQIIMGIATSRLQEGDALPSVRQLADTVGININIPTIPIRLPPSVTATRTHIDGRPTEPPTT